MNQKRTKKKKNLPSYFHTVILKTKPKQKKQILWFRKHIPQFFLPAENTPDQELLAHFCLPTPMDAEVNGKHRKGKDHGLR